mmetsp:Transcript_1801/g.7239  ORF Transcript_1801/g.7239 Transcript_1801/m.7239 type:complete len:244 (+) Transcript_1801:198-929(+)
MKLDIGGNSKTHRPRCSSKKCRGNCANEDTKPALPTASINASPAKSLSSGDRNEARGGSRGASPSLPTQKLEKNNSTASSRLAETFTPPAALSQPPNPVVSEPVELNSKGTLKRTSLRNLRFFRVYRTGLNPTRSGADNFLMCGISNTSQTPSEASSTSETVLPSVRFDATIVRTAAVTSGVAAYRSAPRDAKCASTVSSASAIVSGRRGVDDADASARTTRYGAARRQDGPGRAPEKRPRAR